MDPDVVHDPVFQTLLLQFELESRKLRDAVIAMRAFYLTHDERPLDENVQAKWRGALLSEEACQKHRNVESAAADLLRYGFELAPHSNNALHLEEIIELRMAHRERLEKRSGWKKAAKHHPKGIEEKVHIDGGHPVTWVIHPKQYEFTERARKRREREAAIPPELPKDEGELTGDPPSDVDPVD